MIKKLLLAGDKFMSQIHLRQSRFACSPCETFAKNKKRTQKFKETGDSIYIYQKNLDKACFQHDITFTDFKDLPRRTTSDKVLRDNSFSIAKLQIETDMKQVLF